MSNFTDELVFINNKYSSLGLWEYDNILTAGQYLLAYKKTLAHVKQGANVLDWGCGNLHFSLFLLLKGIKTTAYEFIIPNNLNFIKQKWPDNFRFILCSQSDPVLLPFSSHEFDAVFSVGVLEHVREFGGDEIASLSEIERVLKPGGKFLCFHLPNKHSWIECLIKIFFPDKFSHRFKYTENDIYNMIDNVGLKLDEVGRYGFLPRNELARLPRFIKDSQRFNRVYNLLDSSLATIFPTLVQNYYFIAHKIL